MLHWGHALNRRKRFKEDILYFIDNTFPSGTHFRGDKRAEAYQKGKKRCRTKREDRIQDKRRHTERTKS